MQQKINRFTRILKTREKLREEEQTALGHHRREEDKVLGKLATLGEEKKGALENFSTMSEGALLSCREMWHYRQVVEVIDRRISEGQGSLSTVRKKIADTEVRLIERHRDVKIIDKYVENLSEIKNETEKFSEQEEIDDLATTRFEPKEEQ